MAAGASALAFLHLLARSTFGQDREEALKQARERLQGATQEQMHQAGEG